MPVRVPNIAGAADPKAVNVHLSTGQGMDITWKDGHQSHYTFQYLRDACPCAMCDQERVKSDREPGEGAKPQPGALPMFKAAPKPDTASGVGKYAIQFHWNDGHEHGIYSWDFLRAFCPCTECAELRKTAKQPGEGVTRTTPH
jgi:DUF971 family protein